MLGLMLSILNALRFFIEAVGALSLCANLVWPWFLASPPGMSDGALPKSIALGSFASRHFSADHHVAKYRNGRPLAADAWQGSASAVSASDLVHLTRTPGALGLQVRLLLGGSCRSPLDCSRKRAGIESMILTMRLRVPTIHHLQCPPISSSHQLSSRLLLPT